MSLIVTLLFATTYTCISCAYGSILTGVGHVCFCTLRDHKQTCPCPICVCHWPLCRRGQWCLLVHIGVFYVCVYAGVLTMTCFFMTQGHVCWCLLRGQNKHALVLFVSARAYVYLTYVCMQQTYLQCDVSSWHKGMFLGVRCVVTNKHALVLFVFVRAYRCILLTCTCSSTYNDMFV